MKAIAILILATVGVSGGAAARAAQSAATGAVPSAAEVHEQRAITLNAVYINQLAEQMRANNPALAASRARTNAAGAAIGGVRRWEDPMVRLGGMAAREEFRASDGDLMYGVDQKLPLFGKPALARRVAERELATETANAESQFQNARRELAKELFSAALAEETIRIGRQDLGWLTAISQTLDAKYRVGQATLVEVLQVQNEAVRRTNQLQVELESLTTERLVLNRMLGRGVDSPWPSLELPPAAQPIPYTEKLMNVALRYEPRREVLRKQIEHAQAQLAVVKRQQWPDITASAEARNYTGDGSFRQELLVLSMNVPWFNRTRYKSDIRREEAKIDAIRYELADFDLALRQEVRQLTIRIEAARRQALLYKQDIWPRSQSALESASAGWESGRNTFRDLMDARRMVLESQLMYARSIAEQYQAMTDLVLCCGIGDFEALEMIGAIGEEKRNEK
jgi:outer membrane protein, heavy metal efflux system